MDAKQNAKVSEAPSGVGITQFLSQGSPLHDFQLPPWCLKGIAYLFHCRGESYLAYKKDNKTAIPPILEDFYNRTAITAHKIVQLAQAICNTYGPLMLLEDGLDISEMNAVSTLNILACMLSKYRLIKNSESGGTTTDAKGGGPSVLSGAVLATMSDGDLVAALAGREVKVRVNTGITAAEARAMLKTTSLPVPGSSGAGATTGKDDRVKRVDESIPEEEKTPTILEVGNVMESYHHGDLKFPEPKPVLTVPAFEFTYL